MATQRKAPARKPAAGKKAAGSAAVREVRLDQLVMDADTQVRVEIDEDVAEEYAEAYREGGKDALPPIEAVETPEGEIIPWDGFHRACGCETAGLASIMVRITKGSREDARWLAISANKRHGLKRSNADKRRAAEMAVRMKPALSDRLLAEHAGVGRSLIGDARKAGKAQVSESDTSTPAATPARLSDSDSGELPAEGWQEASKRIAEGVKRVGKDGRAIDTSNIGKPKPAAQPAAPPPEEATPERMPGDDTDEIAAEEAREKELRRANGKPVANFDYRGFNHSFGEQVRWIDKRGDAYGPHEKDSPRAERVRRALAAYRAEFDAWDKAMLQERKEAC